MVGFRKIVRVSSFYVGGTEGQGVLNHVFNCGSLDLQFFKRVCPSVCLSVSKFNLDIPVRIGYEMNSHSSLPVCLR